MATCGKITAGASPDCDNPIFAGVNDKLWLINFDDISGYTVNGTNAEIIEAILLNSGTSAYVFEGQNFSNEPDYAFTRSGFGTFYNHQLRFRVFADDPATKAQINKIGKGKFVAIVQNNYVNTAGNTAFTLYGKGNGLVQQEGTQPKSSVEEGGAHNILLGSHENALEPKIPNSVFITDYATTKAMVEALEA